MRVSPAFLMNAKVNPRRGGEQVAEWRDRLTTTTGTMDTHWFDAPMMAGVVAAPAVAGAMSYTSDSLGLGR